MKPESILTELEAIKARFAAEATDARDFMDRLEAWQDQQPPAGPMIHSLAEWQAYLGSQEAIPRVTP